MRWWPLHPCTRAGSSRASRTGCTRLTHNTRVRQTRCARNPNHAVAPQLSEEHHDKTTRVLSTEADNDPTTQLIQAGRQPSPCPAELSFNSAESRLAGSEFEPGAQSVHSKTCITSDDRSCNWHFKTSESPIQSNVQIGLMSSR